MLAIMREATVNQARALRRVVPHTEQVLWRILRDRRLDGLKFRRQVPIGPYVLDFVRLRHRLVIDQGLRVFRVANADVLNRDWEIIRQILAAVEAPLADRAP